MAVERMLDDTYSAQYGRRAATAAAGYGGNDWNRRISVPEGILPPSIGKLHKLGHFVFVVQLISGLM